MRKTKHPWNYDWAVDFPQHVHGRSWEGGGLYCAYRNGKYYLIYDEGTLADFLDGSDPSDKEVLDRLITVVEFDTEEARQDHLQKAERLHHERG